MKTAYSILETMTIIPYQNLITNVLGLALKEGGYADTELYFEQLTPLVILAQTAEETGQTTEEVQTDINEQAENPDQIDETPIAQSEGLSKVERFELIRQSQPLFTHEYETYKD
jgi:hypothetical protein